MQILRAAESTLQVQAYGVKEVVIDTAKAAAVGAIFSVAGGAPAVAVAVFGPGVIAGAGAGALGGGIAGGIAAGINSISSGRYYE